MNKVAQQSTDAILVLSNLPDQACAEHLAQSLVERKLAACVNILAPCTSVYVWQGKVEKASEIPVLIKSCLDCYPALEAAILELHPYELPEIIHVPIAGGLPAYLNWLAEGTNT